jgi:hypothetical protein
MQQPLAKALVRVCLTPISDFTRTNSKRSRDALNGGSAIQPSNPEDDVVMTCEVSDDYPAESSYDHCRSHGSTTGQSASLGGWDIWNYFGSFLVPDHRIRVCTHIDNDRKLENTENTNRWEGERVVVVSLDRSTSTKGFNDTTGTTLFDFSGNRVLTKRRFREKNIQRQDVASIMQISFGGAQSDCSTSLAY